MESDLLAEWDNIDFEKRSIDKQQREKLKEAKKSLKKYLDSKYKQSKSTLFLQRKCRDLKNDMNNTLFLLDMNEATLKLCNNKYTSENLRLKALISRSEASEYLLNTMFKKLKDDQLKQHQQSEKEFHDQCELELQKLKEEITTKKLECKKYQTELDKAQSSIMMTRQKMQNYEENIEYEGLQNKLKNIEADITIRKREIDALAKEKQQNQGFKQNSSSVSESQSSSYFSPNENQDFNRFVPDRKPLVSSFRQPLNKPKLGFSTKFRL